MRCRDSIQHRHVEVVGDEPRQRRRVGDGLATQDLQHQGTRHREDVLRGRGRIEVLHPVVELGPEKREGRHHGARGNTGDDLEDRPLAAFRPALEEAGAEGSVGATARNGELRIDDPAIRAAREGARFFLLERQREVALHRLAGHGSPAAHDWHIGNRGARAIGQRNGIARQARTSGQGQHRPQQRQKAQQGRPSGIGAVVRVSRHFRSATQRPRHRSS